MKPQVSKTASKIGGFLSAAIIILNLTAFSVAQAGPILIAPFISNATATDAYPYKGSSNYTFSYGGIGSNASITASIIDSNNAIKKSWNFTGAQLGASGIKVITWDGRDTNGTIVPEAFYKFQVSGFNDAATKLGPITSSNFSVTYYTVSLSVSKDPFNPDADGSLNISYTVYGPGNASQKISLTILPVPNPNNNIYANFQNYPATPSKQGSMTANVLWTPAPGIPDGEYAVNAQIVGLKTIYARQFSISHTPSLSIPDISPVGGDYNPTLGSAAFSTNLANVKTTATINAAIYTNNNQIKTWTYDSQKNGNLNFVWDGKNSGNYVTSGQYTFKVWGAEGNIAIPTQQKTFQVYTPANSNPNPNLIPVSMCAGFPDIDHLSPDCEAVTYVKSIGAMTGYDNGTFGPNDVLRRNQIAKIVLTTFKLYNQNVNYCVENPFPDVTPVEWSYQYICLGKSLNVITGYKTGVDAGKFIPARSVNRAEFLGLLLRNLKEQMPANNTSSYLDVALNQWFTGFAKYSYDHSLFSGPNLYPLNVVTRVEVARVLYQLHNLGKI